MAAKFWLGGLLLAGTCVLDPLAVVEPTVTLSATERARLDRGELISRILPARQGQVAVFAAAPIAVSPDVLMAATQDIVDLKKSRFVQAIGRFSDPPQLSDLDGLTLDDHDVEVLAACEAGHCSFKLAAIEIEAIRRARFGDVNGDRLTAALRRVMLERVRACLHAGLAALPPMANRSSPWYLHEVLGAALAESPRLLREPPLSSWIRDEPVADGTIDSFAYWSKEIFGSGKPVILITHVAIYRPSAATAIVIDKQIFASRYLTGGLSMTAISTDDTGQRYLLYLNRSTVDLLGGLFGGTRRSMLESRLADEAPELIGRLSDRLERSHHVSHPRSLRHD